MTDDFFSKLHRDLRDLAQREVAAPRSNRRRAWPAPKRLVFAAVCLVLVVAAAAAATDLLPIGSRVPVKSVGGSHEPKRFGPRVVVATGRTPITGRWQMYWSRSGVGDCEALEFLDERGAAAGGIGEGCGGPEGLTVGALVPVPGAHAPETIIHGRTPEDATAVRVTVPGLGSRDADVQDGPGAVPGNWYLVAFAGIPDRGTATVQALDGGRPAELAKLPITLHPRYASPTASYVGPRRVTVTAGGLVPVALRCARQPKREGKCMGSVGVHLAGLRAKRCRAKACAERRRRLGWQFYRLAPGTERRVVQVRLAQNLRRELARRRTLDAALTLAGRRIRVVLVAP